LLQVIFESNDAAMHHVSLRFDLSHRAIRVADRNINVVVFAAGFDGGLRDIDDFLVTSGGE